MGDSTYFGSVYQPESIYYLKRESYIKYSITVLCLTGREVGMNFVFIQNLDVKCIKYSVLFI